MGKNTPWKKRKPAFEHHKSVTKFQFKQTCCGKIAQLTSSNFMVKKFSGLIFPENIASLSYPPNTKISTFQQMALNGYDTFQPVGLPPSSSPN
jgi:hypothetical protein